MVRIENYRCVECGKDFEVFTEEHDEIDEQCTCGGELKEFNFAQHCRWRFFDE